MNKVLIVKNISHEGPGLLAGLLEKHDLSYDLIDLDEGEAFPSPSGYKAVVVLGGPDSANDSTDKMSAELERIREILDTGIPYLGVCLGLQTMVKAGGGTVVPAKTKEHGFIGPDGNNFTVELTDAGKSDPLFADLDAALEVFHLHGETVELANDMKLLATGKFCNNQIVKLGENAYGIQSHFELTAEMLSVWARNDPDLAPIGEEKLTSDFKKIKDAYTQTGNRIFSNFLKIAGLI